MNLRPVCLDGEQQARASRGAVEDHRAGAADAVLAADVRPGKAESVADEIREEEARLDDLAVAAAVDRKLDRDHALTPSVAFRQAPISARSTTSAVRCRW